jgi:mono/diheme cytochrome c family protein
MSWLVFLAPFVVIGALTVVFAFSGGTRRRGRRLRRARASGTGGGTGTALKVGVTVLALGLGLAVPAAVIASRSAGLGRSSELADQDLSPQLRDGKVLFGQNCASCHSLAASNARGATGPDLDQLGRVSEERVLNAINNGGTGDLRMPAGLLEEEQAKAVSAYVSAVAGR